MSLRNNFGLKTLFSAKRRHCVETRRLGAEPRFAAWGDGREVTAIDDMVLQFLGRFGNPKTLSLKVDHPLPSAESPVIFVSFKRGLVRHVRVKVTALAAGAPFVVQITAVVRDGGAGIPDLDQDTPVHDLRNQRGRFSGIPHKLPANVEHIVTAGNVSQNSSQVAREGCVVDLSRGITAPWSIRRLCLRHLTQR